MMILKRFSRAKFKLIGAGHVLESEFDFDMSSLAQILVINCCANETALLSMERSVIIN